MSKPPRATVPEPIAHTTHTYAVLDVSCEAYQEIRRRLVEAGPEYEYKIDGDEAGEVIDMNGLALSELEPAPTEVKTLPQYNDPIAGAATALSISCSCSGPEIGLEPATLLSRAAGGDSTPTVEFMCHYCAAAVLIVRHETIPDEYFRKAGSEPEKDLG